MQRGNTTLACASCKHQRKKCVEKCVLAPFFPVDRTREFQAVHRVFGVSNITKIVTSLKEEDRKRAVDSLVWEALCRLKDPVLGPYGEYRRVCEELRLYKSQYHQLSLPHHIPSQGNNAMYKGATAHGLVGWGNAKVVASNGAVNLAFNTTTNATATNNNTNGNFHHCHHVQDAAEALRVESDNSSALILPQQHLGNGFNQHYFLAAGHFNPLDSKSVESTFWEGSS